MPHVLPAIHCQCETTVRGNMLQLNYGNCGLQQDTVPYWHPSCHYGTVKLREITLQCRSYYEKH